MRSKILTKEEKEKIEKIANKILEPISGKVSISENYSTINCSMSSDGGYNRGEWNEYWYKINIKSDKENHEYSEAFNESSDPLYLAQVAWGITHTAWNKFDGDINGLLAGNLWPAENGNLPDYKKLSKI